MPSIMLLFFAFLLVIACQPKLASITEIAEPMAATTRTPVWDRAQKTLQVIEIAKVTKAKKSYARS
jgi:hypothetical protein